MSMQPPSAEGSSQLSKTSQSIKPLATSNISLFLSNLRLLNLDKRPDWPDVTLRTFDAKDALQNQKKRISCVEWILFRLFQILDPEMTKDKLQPFFPPLEPLQSINLRAALFRCFNDLKKNGVLGREIVVRKTMLDDCKGDKFEEMLVIFSNLALRRRLGLNSRGNAVPVARAVGTAANLNPPDVQNLAPLVLAHRVSLHAMFRQRAEKKVLFRDFHHAIKAEHERILQSHEQVNMSKRAMETTLSPDAATLIRDEVHRNWVGSTEGSTILLDGDAPLPSISDTQNSYFNTLETFRQTGLLPVDESEPTLLRQLDETLKHQTQRLAQWREYGELIRMNDQSGKDVATTGIMQSATVEKVVGNPFFTEHQSLRVGSMTDNAPTLPVGDSTLPYSKIVASMHHEISEVSERRRRERLTSVAKPRRKQADIDQAAHGLRSLANDSRTSLADIGKPPLLRATSQRTKLDFFSPLKGRVYPPSSPDVPPETLKPVSSPDNALYHDMRSKAQTERGDSGGSLDSSVLAKDHRNLGVENTVDIDEHESQTSLGNVDDYIKPELKGGPLKRPAPTSEPSFTQELPPLPTVMENGGGIQGLPSIPAELPEKSSSAANVVANNERVSLAERTRQSMASIAFGPHSGIQRRQSKLETPHASYPVNQFETPIKSQKRISPKIPDDLKPPDDEETTPRDRLFSNDAEYASVFKSRPKIAASPVLSPSYDDLTSIGYGAGDIQQIDSSPLGAMGFR